MSEIELDFSGDSPPRFESDGYLRDAIPLPTTETISFEMKNVTILDITIVDENGVKTMLKVRNPKIKIGARRKKLKFDIVSYSKSLNSKL